MEFESIKKYIYILIATLSLALGIIGIFIPVLPTTPFLLLASFCYMRSSEKMYHWIIHHKIFGEYIYSYLTYKAIPNKTKIGAMVFLWVTLIISIFLVKSISIRILLFAIGAGVTIHLMTLKTLGDKELEALNDLYGNQPKEQI